MDDFNQAPITEMRLIHYDVLVRKLKDG